MSSTQEVYLFVTLYEYVKNVPTCIQVSLGRVHSGVITPRSTPNTLIMPLGKTSVWLEIHIIRYIDNSTFALSLDNENNIQNIYNWDYNLESSLFSYEL